MLVVMAMVMAMVTVIAVSGLFHGAQGYGGQLLLPLARRGAVSIPC